MKFYKEPWANYFMLSLSNQLENDKESNKGDKRFDLFSCRTWKLLNIMLVMGLPCLEASADTEMVRPYWKSIGTKVRKQQVFPFFPPASFQRNHCPIKKKSSFSPILTVVARKPETRSPESGIPESRCPTCFVIKWRALPFNAKDLRIECPVFNLPTTYPNTPIYHYVFWLQVVDLQLEVLQMLHAWRRALIRSSLPFRVEQHWETGKSPSSSSFQVHFGWSLQPLTSLDEIFSTWQ